MCNVNFVFNFWVLVSIYAMFGSLEGDESRWKESSGEKSRVGRNGYPPLYLNVF